MRARSSKFENDSKCHFVHCSTIIENCRGTTDAAGQPVSLRPLYTDDCIGATSCSKELDHFMTSVNSFQPALKYTWEISETSVSFLDIQVQSIATAYLLVCTIKLQIPTVICHILLIFLSRVKNSIPFSQFLRF